MRRLSEILLLADFAFASHSVHFNNTVPRHHPPKAMLLLADLVVSIEPSGGRALCASADLGLPISSAPPP